MRPTVESRLKIALLGAESTGKTQLAQALVAALQAKGVAAAWVPEVLREWCAARRRTPQAHEQKTIAHEQARRVEQHLAREVLIADTTPLMTAVYSDLLFNDTSLYTFALAHQASYALNLVTGLDLPWVADALQRDGPQAQARVDQRLRQVLHTHDVPYCVVYGSDARRCENALHALAWQQTRAQQAAQHLSQRWTWACQNC